MRRIIVNSERPELVIVKGKDSKPCQYGYYTEEERFWQDHQFIVHLYAADDAAPDERKYLGMIGCQYVNADSVSDIEQYMKLGLKKILEKVITVDYAVNNLAIVTNAAFARDAAYDDLDLAFSRLHCILCSVMGKEFGIPGCGSEIGIYFDYAHIESEAAKVLKRFVGEYKDGDMRRENFEDESAWYVHKIPWPPAKQEDTE